MYGAVWKSFHSRALNKIFKLIAENGRNILENETKQSNIFGYTPKQEQNQKYYFMD